MKETYSTIRRDMTSGRVYSSRTGGLIAGTIPHGAARSPVAPGLVPAGAAAEREAVRVALLPQAVPGVAGLDHATGNVSLTAAPDGAAVVEATLSGLPGLSDQAFRPVLWLVHDLRVPDDLSPSDLTLLPRGVSGTGNRPGSVFTVDGNPVQHGSHANGLTIAVSPGAFEPHGPVWRLGGRVDGATNRAFHPLAVLGPAYLANIDAALPSGTVARILANVFMRRATVHPELDLKQHFAHRLITIALETLALNPATYLPVGQFDRVAVTIEGIVRATPRLMPTAHACWLLGNLH